MRKMTRNLIIFAFVTLTAGFVGIGLDRLSPPPTPMEGLGALLWLTAPLLCAVLLRAVGGDGWADFGLRPRLAQAGRWYAVAVLLPIGITLVALLAGWLGGVPLAFEHLGAYPALVLAGLGGYAVKNLFEEFAWRGYLAPRLAARGVHPYANALLTGLVWAGWHIPYYLYYLDRSEMLRHTTLSVPAFILLALCVLPFQALAYNELRLISGSVWPAWLMHNVANAITLPLVSAGIVTTTAGAAGVLLAAGTDGVLVALLYGAAGVWLYRRRTALAAQPALAAA